MNFPKVLAGMKQKISDDKTTTDGCQAYVWYTPTSFAMHGDLPQQYKLVRIFEPKWFASSGGGQISKSKHPCGHGMHGRIWNVWYTTDQNVYWLLHKVIQYNRSHIYYPECE